MEKILDFFKNLKVIDLVSWAWDDVENQTIIQSFRACGIKSNRIEEFNFALVESLMFENEPVLSSSNSSALLSDFSLNSSMKTNPFPDDGVFYRRDDDSVCRIRLARGPLRIHQMITRSQL